MSSKPILQNSWHYNKTAYQKLWEIVIREKSKLQKLIYLKITCKNFFKGWSGREEDWARRTFRPWCTYNSGERRDRVKRIWIWNLRTQSSSAQVLPKLMEEDSKPNLSVGEILQQAAIAQLFTLWQWTAWESNNPICHHGTVGVVTRDCPVSSLRKIWAEHLHSHDHNSYFSFNKIKTYLKFNYIKYIQLDDNNEF